MLQILSEHLKRYPLMQPQDVVKLLYQSEFGPGHMVTDRDACLKWLKEEYDDLSTESGDLSVPGIQQTEDIGSGFARINLAALDTDALSLEELADWFIRSANCASGDTGRFSEKLEQLKNSYWDLPFAFTYEELTDFLEKYKAAGCPAVHHSELYRLLYRPAYRVVKIQE